MSPVYWRRRKRGTRRQRGKPFPIVIGKPVLRKVPMKIYHVGPPKRNKLDVHPSKPISAILSTLNLIFPQFSPIFEAGRFIVNNKEFFAPFVKALFSNKSSNRKIADIEREIQESIKQTAIPKFSKESSRMITELIEQHIGFESIVKKIDPNMKPADTNVFQLLFKDTLEKSIERLVREGFASGLQ